MTPTIILAHNRYKVFSPGCEQTMQAEPVIVWLIDEDGTVGSRQAEYERQGIKSEVTA
jgi:hypothetical protein